MRKTRVGPSVLARRLGTHEKEASRLLDPPRHASKAEALKRALLAVGRRLAIEVQKPA
ncbi:MAG: hypothetical protein LJE69_10375 [Thiohalocapsa sp.]|uniref:hypothetical protein n=1 Tax=Thiohalocapsa sp. TaxID=2497641 RepID=UPI0025E5931F|nr:hypothetical protein [Thiohalocapsa sp.]MCG6941641.1 hypothetical protein [Thiohalocapsa sp.]